LKKSLFIVSKAPSQESVSLLPSLSGSREDVSVVLVQDGVKHQTLPFSHVFVLSDDVLSRKLTSPFPSVSYQELIGMIFKADTVAVL
jgi:sulfur transfer complex TusBCD TusB component (DsrH family)